MVVSSTYLRLLIFLLAILIPVCDSSSPAYVINSIDLYTNIVVKYGFQCFLWRKVFTKAEVLRPTEVISWLWSC